MNKTRLDGLDLFRGLAAMCVVAFHFPWALHLPKFNFGFLAVDLFFVLSGVVLGRNYRDKILAGFSFAEFAWQRLRRLYPMLFLATALIVGLDVLHAPPSLGSTDAIAPALSLALLLPYSATFGAGALFAADSPVWSLWAELVVNVIWFASLRIGRGFTRNLFIASAVALVVVVLLRGTMDGGVKSGVVNMALAVLRAFAWFGVGYAIALRKTAPAMPAWAAMLCMAASGFLVEREWLGGVSQILFVVSGVALLLSLMQWSPRQPAVSAACAWLGLVSYPLYMSHMAAARIALWATDHGVRLIVAHLVAFVVVAVVATLLNEAVIRRLTARQPQLQGFRRTIRS